MSPVNGSSRALAVLILLASAGCSDPAASAADSGPMQDSVVPDIARDAPADAPDAPADAAPDSFPDMPIVADVGTDTTDTSMDGDGSADGPTHLEQLSSPQDYQQLQGVYDHVLFLLRVDGQKAPAPLDTADCTFQDTMRFPSHMEFLTHFSQLSNLGLDDYCDMVEGDARVLWGGRLIQQPTITHPRSGLAGVIVYQVYQGQTELLSVEQFVEIDQRLKGCVPYANQQLALLAIGSQVPHVEQLEALLNAQGVDVVYANQLP